MDQKDLIETITKEVLKQLGNPSQGSTAPPTQTQAASTSLIADKLGIHNPKDMAKYIDHTLLKPESKAPAFDQLCREAIDYQF